MSDVPPGDRAELVASTREAFAATYDGDAELVGHAPGRVNGAVTIEFVLTDGENYDQVVQDLLSVVSGSRAMIPGGEFRHSQ